MKRKNRFDVLVMTLCMVVCVICLWTKVEVQAADITAARYAWRDEMGNIMVSVTDKKRSSSYAYETIGFTVSRCILGTKKISPAYEYVTYSFTSPDIKPSVTELENGLINTIFMLRESTFLQDIVTYYPDWYADLNSKKTCYVVIDSIMRCIQYDANGNKKISGILIDDGSRTGKVRGNTYWNVIDAACRDCGGELPPLMDGFMSSEWGISSTPICALYHPNRKDGSVASDVKQ